MSGLDGASTKAEQSWLYLERLEFPDTPILMMLPDDAQRDYIAGLFEQCGYVARQGSASVDGSPLVMAPDPQKAATAEPLAPTGELTVLTTREAQVLKLVTAGCTSKEIAIKLDISPRTVENYRAQIMRKLDANCLAELIRIALRVTKTVGTNCY